VLDSSPSLWAEPFFDRAQAVVELLHGPDQGRDQAGVLDPQAP
jgi:hypothetical protein